MSFLYQLAEWRTPIVTAFLSVLTYLGDEAFVILFALLVYWCVDKRGGYALLIVSFTGLYINQFLKITFRIPRPWVLDPDFSAVSSAIPAATGYSFPSGHAQNIADVMGCVAMAARRRWLRICALLLIALVAFSRLYLGVHTPLDVLVSLLVGAALVLIFVPLLHWTDYAPRIIWCIMAVFLAAAIAFLLYLELYAFPADVNADNLADARKNGYLILGSCVGMMLIYWLDRRFVRFRTEAPLPGQLLKLTLGAGLALGIKAVLKAPLLALTGGHPAAHGIRYFIIVVFVGIVWPLTFPLWEKVGRKAKREALS